MLAVYMTIAVAMGCLLAVQPAVNGRLRIRVGDAVHAALISSTISACSLLLYSLIVVRKPWPESAQLTAAPWWLWTGGLMGAVYVTISLVLLTRLGGAVYFASIVVGQMFATLVMDHFGLLGLTRHEVNPWRVLGAAFLVAGVVLIRRF
ncbi:MAG TPA: DMT family transporter [Thermomicrobiales bacterium]